MFESSASTDNPCCCEGELVHKNRPYNVTTTTATATALRAGRNDGDQDKKKNKGSGGLAALWNKAQRYLQRQQSHNPLAESLLQSLNFGAFSPDDSLLFDITNTTTAEEEHNLMLPESLTNRLLHETDSTFESASKQLLQGFALHDYSEIAAAVHDLRELFFARMPMRALPPHLVRGAICTLMNIIQLPSFEDIELHRLCLSMQQLIWRAKL